MAYLNVLAGIGVFIGASSGGLLAHYLKIEFMNKLLFLFLISGVLRFIIVLLILPKIKEVRKAEKPVLYLKEAILNKGLVYDIVDGIARIKNSLKPKS